MNKILTNWFYKTDFILDEGDLDAFHDRSIVKKEAKRLANLIYALLALSFVAGALIF